MTILLSWMTVPIATVKRVVPTKLTTIVEVAVVVVVAMAVVVAVVVEADVVIPMPPVM